MITSSIRISLKLVLVPAIFLFVLVSSGFQMNEVVDPCELLNDKLLQEFFEVDLEALNRKTSSSSNPTCTVDWVKPNMEELKKKHQEAMSQYMQDKMAGKDVKMPKYPGNNAVSLTIYKDAFKDNSSAQRSFNSAMLKLQTGTTTEINGKTKTMFQYDTEPVDSIGDDAHWVEGLSQLSVLSGLRIFHLKVKVFTTANENRKSAEFIANRLVSSIH